jgi:hypothetical protein
MSLKVSRVAAALVAVALGVAIVCCGPCAAATRPAPTRRAAPADIPAPIYGVTVDSTHDLSAIVTALSKLSKKVTVRIVFDRGMHPADYREAVEQIHKVAYLLAEPADSSYVEHYTLDQYKALFTEYLKAFGDEVELWEIGNEVNGNWLGPVAEVEAKTSAAYDIVKAAGKKTVLTLVYNEGLGCAASPPDCAQAGQYEMYTWVQAHVPERMKRGVDYVLFSYYPGHSPEFKPDWKREFAKTGDLFPHAKLGFGELGIEGSEAGKAALIDQYYPMRIDHPRYIKGFFWWYFRQDMVPYTKPLWGVLDRAISK